MEDKFTAEDVKKSLEYLKKTGNVIHNPKDDTWTLTDAGVREAESILFEDSVIQWIYEGIKKGQIEFQGKQITADEWLALSADEKETYPFRATKDHGEILLQNLLFSLSKQKVEIIKRVYSAEDESIQVELTDTGEAVKEFARRLGINFGKFMSSIVETGMTRYMDGFIIYDSKKLLKGNKRVYKW